MISSSIYTNEDLGKYPEGIQKALEYLMSRDFTQMEPGTYAIDGKDIYAMVMDITTCASADKRPEIHKKYADVQFVAKGREMLGYAPDIGDLTVADGKEEGDIYFYDDVGDASFLIATKGCYNIFFPNDIHRPGCMVDHPGKVRKVVVKVSMDRV